MIFLQRLLQKYTIYSSPIHPFTPSPIQVTFICFVSQTFITLSLLTTDMASLIPGFEYDIFISYRQKDNKYDGWVTQFVEHLKAELESTFKEEITVYFDINPHDGLLETHDVDASLKDKLKCLIFIPILSRTYCDPKAFAWEHEFKAFVEQASHDQFGLKIKLPNGNVASRVLPIRIHDLDIVDIKLCEDILNGVLRGVEFIYKEPGVNRSLTPDDDEKINLNKTKYRNQINKVALAISDIIQGLKTEPEWIRLKDRIVSESLNQSEVKKLKSIKEQSGKSSKTRFLFVFGIVVILAISAVIIYPRFFGKNTIEKLRSSGERISVAVMPFQNLTNDTIWNVWQEGIQENLITSLSNSEELKVRQVESITGLLQSKGFTNYASITPSVAIAISQKLEAKLVIYGTINQAGLTMRLNAQLIDSKSEEILKSFQIEGQSGGENIFFMIDSLSMRIKNFLLISNLEKELQPDYRSIVSSSTTSPEAYRYFIYGEKAFKKRDYTTGRDWFLKAIAIDSNFLIATNTCCMTYINQGLYDQAKKLSLKLYEKREKVPMIQRIMINELHALLYETPIEAIKYLKQGLEFDDQSPVIYYTLGLEYNKLYQYDKAIPEFEKALEIYDKWGSKPWWDANYTLLGSAYHNTGLYKKEKKLYKKAEQDFPGDPIIIYRQAILALTEGDTIKAGDYINKYIPLCKESSVPEANIAANLAGIYSEAGILDKAEKNYRKALILEPNAQFLINNLAYYLIDKEQKIKEGIEFADKALKLNPNNWRSLHYKGWGLYKMGEYEEALSLLTKSDSLKPIYNHDLYLHLEAARKAVAGQK
jgi:tetratricopeptide (TPR) repeat protein